MSLFYSEFNSLLDQATGTDLLEPDFGKNTELCDMLRMKEVKTYNALSSLQRKISPNNQHKALLAITILEMLTANCGTDFIKELCKAENIDVLEEWVMPGVFNETIRQRLLSFIQNIVLGMKGNVIIFKMENLYSQLKMTGYKFPEESLSVGASFFQVVEAPDWKDSSACYSCDKTFSVVNRKHHCRNCGDIFCGSCSSNMKSLPKYGLEKPVRVCDECFRDGSKKKRGLSSGSSGVSEPSSRSVLSNYDPKQEEEELAQAIAESLKESERQRELEKTIQEQNKVMAMQGGLGLDDSFSNPTPNPNSSNNNSSYESTSNFNNYAAVQNSELAAYISQSSSNVNNSSNIEQFNESNTNPGTGIVEDLESEVQQSYDRFVKSFTPTVKLFERKLASAKESRRNISMDNTVKSLHESAIALQPKLLELVEDTEAKKLETLELKHKIKRIIDTRNAILELKRRHKEEQELLQRMQLEMKLKLIQQQEHQQRIAQQQQIQHSYNTYAFPNPNLNNTNIISQPSNNNPNGTVGYAKPNQHPPSQNNINAHLNHSFSEQSAASDLSYNNSNNSSMYPNSNPNPNPNQYQYQFPPNSNNNHNPFPYQITNTPQQKNHSNNNNNNVILNAQNQQPRPQTQPASVSVDQLINFD